MVNHNKNRQKWIGSTQNTDGSPGTHGSPEIFTHGSPGTRKEVKLVAFERSRTENTSFTKRSARLVQ